MLHNAVKGGGCQLSRKNASRRSKIQRYKRYEGVGGRKIPSKKAVHNT